MENISLKSLTTTGSYFVYDIDGFEDQALKIKSGAAKVLYACKANPLSSIILTLQKLGYSFDTSSEGEMRFLLSLGVPGSQISLTGPMKSEQLLKLCLENHIYSIVIESPNQLELLQKLSKNYAFKPNVLFRVQLKISTDKSNRFGWSKVTPFGMDTATIKDMLSKLTLPFLGFQVFQWSNILSLDELYKKWDMAISECKKLTSDFKVMDVGGGIGIPYYKDKSKLEWYQLNELILNLKQKYNIVEFWLELGRYMVGPYGIYLTKVMDIKKIYGKHFVVLAGGINHLMLPVMSKLQLPVKMLRSSNSPLKSFKLTGPLCMGHDCFGDYYLPKDIAVGDVLVFKHIGAYGFTHLMPYFLSHDMPGEAVIKNGEISIIRSPIKASSWLK